MTGEADKVEKALAVVLEVTGTRLSDAAVSAILARLGDYDADKVVAALRRCMDECKHRLTLADILERIPGRAMGAEEAWGIALKARVYDEQATVVVPEAVFRAFPFELWPDRIAARMAFRERYPALAAECGEGVHVSLGHDAGSREQAIEEAVQLGHITSAQALPFLPAEDEKPASLGWLKAEAERRANPTPETRTGTRG